MAKIRKEKRRLDYKAPDFTVTDIDLSFDLDLKATKVVAVSNIKRLTADKSVPLVLDGDSLKLKRVLVNGKEYSYVETSTSLTLAEVPDEFELTIETEINPKDNSELMGLYVSDGKYCTQCEPEGFRRITFFLDHPDVLAKYTTHITAKEGEFPFMLSNGNMISDTVNNGLRTVTWQDPFPKPSYLFALVAGDFDELQREFTTKSGRKVDVRLYVDKGMRARGEFAIASILKSMEWDEKRFNLEYDLDRFMVVAVDFFNAGAMENKGLNIFNSKYVLADARSATDTDIENVLSVIGHEYFHNWTGDRVTCRDWFQLSLKEGLTVFRDQEFSSDVGCRPIERIKAIKVIRGPQFAEDAGPMAHPIRPDFVMEMNNFYSVTVYDKGAEVIRMIHTILGETNFQKGMKLYFERHDGKAVTCEDFVASMEDASGIDLKQFRNWYSQAGTPIVTVAMDYNVNAKVVKLNLKQNTPATPNQPTKEPFVIPVSLALYSQDGKRIPLARNGEALNEVQLLKAAEEEWSFDNVSEKPIVALFQNFSAPVKCEYDYTEDELTALLKYADDTVVRYDAAQKLINDYVKLNVENAKNGKELTRPNAIINAFKYILGDESIDNRFAAFLLKLPTFNTLMELSKDIDIDALKLVRSNLFTVLSKELHAEFKNAYEKMFSHLSDRIHFSKPYECNEEQMGQRALSSTVMHYYLKGLLENGQADCANEIAMAHYRISDNMTDTLAVLDISCNLGLSCQDIILSDFEIHWKDNPLVFDNYFRAVATEPFPNTIERVKELMSHSCFDMNNPNRVRALIGAFAMANSECFHSLDGSGYEFLTDIIGQLNKTNAHLAARLVTPMLCLNRLDSKRKQLITDCFNKLLANKKLSDAVFEVIDKAMKQ